MLNLNQNIKNLINEVHAPTTQIDEEVEPTDTHEYGPLEFKEVDTPMIKITPSKQPLVRDVSNALFHRPQVNVRDG